MDTAIEARVRRGIARLDERGPEGWRDRLDLERLDIFDPFRCVVGQLYPDNHHAGYVALGCPTGPEAAKLGLFWTSVSTGNENERLTAEWRRQLGGTS